MSYLPGQKKSRYSKILITNQYPLLVDWPSLADNALYSKRKFFTGLSALLSPAPFFQGNKLKLSISAHTASR